MADRQTVHHIILVGTGGVGKSALVSRFLTDAFPEEYRPTRADSFTKSLLIDSKYRCTIDILDTAGQEAFSAMRDNYYRTGDGFLLVFSLTDRSSFEAMPIYYDQISRVTDREEPVVILVGNKADLKAQRQVCEEEARDLAASWPKCVYLETSARDSQNVQDAFLTITRTIMVDKEAFVLKAAEDEPANPCCIIG